MLSAETAIGADPVGVVSTMARIAERADTEFDYEGWARRIRLIRKVAVGDGDEQLTDAMTAAAWRAASDIGAAAIICISDSGLTVRSIARFRPTMPIIGFSPNERTARQLSMSWGTTPLAGASPTHSVEMMDDLVKNARDRGLVRTGDMVAVLAGAGSRARATDLLHLVRVP